MLNNIIQAKILENNIILKKQEIREMLFSLGLTSENDTYKLTTLPDYLFFKVVLGNLEITVHMDFKDRDNWFCGADDVFEKQYIVDIDIKSLKSTIIDQFAKLINEHLKD